MKSQTVVNPKKIMDRFRALGNKIRVVEGEGFENDLARWLDMPECEPHDLAQAVLEFVDEGQLNASNVQLSLGKGGAAEDEVFVDGIEFSVV